MKCIFCYVSPILITNAKSQAMKGLILYNNANGIISLKIHIYADHCMIAEIFEEKVNNMLKDAKKQLGKKRFHVNGTTISEIFEEKVNNLLKDAKKQLGKKRRHVNGTTISEIFEEKINNLLKEAKKQLGKKRPHVNGTIISNFFIAKHSYKKDDVQEKQFLEDLILLIVRNHLLMHLVESQWLKNLLCICVQRLFCLLENSFRIFFCYNWWKKKLYILPALINRYFVTMSSDM
jgi:hypothetical protein